MFEAFESSGKEDWNDAQSIYVRGLLAPSSP
jgi:hypothetical protein